MTYIFSYFVKEKHKDLKDLTIHHIIGKAQGFKVRLWHVLKLLLYGGFLGIEKNKTSNVENRNKSFKQK